jgi:nucleoside-diphosphate-sugar epimerase
VVEVLFAHPIQSEQLLDVIRARSWDLLAHHAADIPNYRDASYDPMAGFVRNTAGGPELITAMARSGARAVITTGTVFQPAEGGEGAGALAVNPYGLSKGLTNEAFRHLTRWAGMAFAQFIIAAPFGPREEGRLVWSLFQAWMAGEPAVIRTPAYVRDHLPAPLLAAAYVRLVNRMLEGGVEETFARPSGMVQTVGAFARRVAMETERRLAMPCLVTELAQTEFPEPVSRVNSDPAIPADWDEPAFWDSYVAYYRELAARGWLARSSA